MDGVRLTAEDIVWLKANNMDPWVRARYGVTGLCWDMHNRYPVTNGWLGNFCTFCGDRV